MKTLQQYLWQRWFLDQWKNLVSVCVGLVYFWSSKLGVCFSVNKPSVSKCLQNWIELGKTQRSVPKYQTCSQAVSYDSDLGPRWIFYETFWNHPPYTDSPIYQLLRYLQSFRSFYVLLLDQISQDFVAWGCLSRFYWCWFPDWQLLPCVAGISNRHLDYDPPHQRPGLPHCDHLSSKGLQHSPLPWPSEGWQ